MIFLMMGLRLLPLILRLPEEPDGISSQHGIILRSRDRWGTGSGKCYQALQECGSAWFRCKRFFYHISENGQGDVLIAWENEAFFALQNIRASMKLSFLPHLYCASQRLRRLTRSRRWMARRSLLMPIYLSCTLMKHRDLKHRTSTDR